MSYENWERKGLCAPQNRPEYAEAYDWFSGKLDARYDAMALCHQCPVRKKCLQTALDRGEIHGVWGGVDEYEVRRTLSVNALGSPMERDRPPRCPYCKNRKLKISGNKTPGKGYYTECSECELHWYLAKIPTKLKNKKVA